MSSLWIWIGIAAVLGVIELFTLELIFIMFAAGALGAGVAGALGAGPPLQILVAAAVSAIGLLVVRPIGMRYLKNSSPDSVSNVEALIGQPVRILETVSAKTGTAQINGETWSARPGDPNAEYVVGDAAIVNKIDGAYLIITSPPDIPRGGTANQPHIN
ncbi:MAG: NfeD family protein [Actinobacteria bacterium]|nr:NfeD family protein [Actinomycetota bacterium]